MSAEIIHLPLGRLESARQRAKRLLGGEEMGRFSHGRGGFDLDLSTFKCGLCRGDFPPVGWATWMIEDEHSVYFHEGCAKTAENWAWTPEDGEAA